MGAFVKILKNVKNYFSGELPNNFIQEFQKKIKSYQTSIYDDCRDTYNYAQ